jgi:hypothetical protein
MCAMRPQVIRSYHVFVCVATWLLIGLVIKILHDY